MLLLLVIYPLIFVSLAKKKKKKDYVATETAHCYNNTVSVDDVAISKKECDDLTEADSKSIGGFDFNDDTLQEAYQQI